MYYVVRSREVSDCYGSRHSHTEYYLDDWSPSDKESLVKELNEAEARNQAGKPPKDDEIEYIFEVDDDMCLTFDPEAVKILLAEFAEETKKQATIDKRAKSLQKTNAKKRRRKQYLKLKEEFDNG